MRNESAPEVTKREPAGVGGFLIYVMISLFVGTPFVIIDSIVGIRHALRDAEFADSAWRSIQGSTIGLNVMLVLFWAALPASIAAGVLLAMERKLWIHLATSVVFLFTLSGVAMWAALTYACYFAPLGPSIPVHSLAPAAAAAAGIGALRNLMMCLIWLLVLKRSKRIANTCWR